MPEDEFLTWSQVCERLKADDVAEYNSDTLTFFRTQNPPIPIAKIAKRGQAHKFIYNQVLEWVFERKKNEKKTYSQENPVNSENAISRKLMAEAELAELKLAKAKGELVDAEEVKNQYFGWAREIRDRMRSIPTRMAPTLTGETDQARVFTLLSNEVNDALRELANDPLISQ